LIIKGFWGFGVLGFWGFGIGLDSHIAGILPDSPAVTEPGIVCEFDGGQFERITIAPSFFERITEGIIYTEGAVKAEAFEKLSEDLPVETYPDQLIKQCQSYKLIYNQEGV
jgi:6-phosphogluconolactonase/glucosamine-6-phosphate isomerase/deaminase